ncbi:MAG: phosphatase PAP2 family protein [Coriobacteriia bacterium]|nr:phosphatase PAP2 family protein [Coriobacteriia bacterium]
MEIEFLLMLQNLRANVPDAVNVFFEQLSEGVGGTALVLFGAVVFWCIDKRAGYLMTVCYLASSAVNQLIKNIACVYRPWILDSRITPVPLAQEGATGYSFPSGHTTCATSALGAFAIWQRKRPWLAAIAIALILFTAISRMWLGVHMPKDVLTALALTTIMVLTCWKITRLLEEHPEKDIVVAAIVVAFSLVALAFCTLKTYPLHYDAAGMLLVDPEDMKADCFSAFGAFMAFGVCWLAERRLIKFTVEGDLKTRVIRALVGAALVAGTLGLLSLAVKPLLPVFAYKFIKHALLVALVVLAYPACFMEARKKRLAKDFAPELAATDPAAR